MDVFSSNDPLPPGPLPYADINNPRSLNKYTYTYNNPIRYTDPNGHCPDGAPPACFGIEVPKTSQDVDRIERQSETGLSVLGLFPGPVGVFANVVNAGIALFSGDTTGAVLNAAAAFPLGKAAKLGKEGEQAAGIIKNTRRIESITGTAAYRVPDEITKAGIREVKNVKELSFTSQIKDLFLAAQKEGKPLTLSIRRNTKLSKPLQELVKRGEIKIEYIN